MIQEVEMLQYLHYHPESLRTEVKTGMSLDVSTHIFPRFYVTLH